MTRTCRVRGCGRPVHAKELCKGHYQQQWRTGAPEITRPNPRGTPEERFWRYVGRGEPDTCWEWTGRRDKDGYGTLKVGKRTIRAHRYAYERRHGSIPDGLGLRHTCNNPPCCNDAHLIPGDHVTNMADRSAAGHYATGEAHHAAKFSDEVVASVKSAEGTYAQIAVRFGMSISQVGNIKRGRQRQ